MVLFGPDVSHYQAGIDLKRAAAEGHSFVIGKISQGSTFADSQWPKTRDQGRAAGLIVIGYHYVDTSNPDQQAATCARAIGDKSIPVALDWESGGGNFSNLAAVAAAFRRAGLNVRLVYTGAWYWQQVGSPDMRSLGLPLWKSRYPTTAPGSPSALYAKVPASYWAPVGGLETKLLQFTDHASVAGMSVDCSAFNGTREQLLELLGATTPAPAPEDDTMTDADRQMLKDVHDALPMLRDIWAQLAGQDAKPGEFTGWPTWDGGSGEKLTLVDYARRNNVQVTALITALTNALAGKAP